jgi:hypothetical protein
VVGKGTHVTKNKKKKAIAREVTKKREPEKKVPQGGEDDPGTIPEISAEEAPAENDDDDGFGLPKSRLRW